MGLGFKLSMTAIVASCRTDFSAHSLSTLMNLRDEYIHLSGIEQQSNDNDLFFQTLLETTNHLLLKITMKDEL